MIPLTFLYDEYIDRPKFTEQKKNPFEYIVPSPTSGVGTITSKIGCANPLVPIYSLKKKPTVTTDNLEKVIGWVFSTEDHPVIDVSKKLSQAKQRCSNIEQSTLAVVILVAKLKHFLLGRRFTFEVYTQTDHKLLKYLFAPDKKFPKLSSARITRLEIALMEFDFELKCTPRSDFLC